MKLYQANNKEKFLETVITKEIYTWLFSRLFDVESKLGKDLYDFDKKEILAFYKELNNSFTTLKSYNSMISKYTEWAIKHNLKRINKNYASMIFTDELKKVSKEEPDVIHFHIIYELIGKEIEGDYTPLGLPRLKNAQDKLLIYLIFLGLRGKSTRELTHLKREHIDRENMIIKVSEIDPQREDFLIDEYALKLLDDASNEREYLRYIDETTDATNTREDYEIIGGYDYIFRKSNIGKYRNKSNLSHQGILARLSTLSKHVGEKLTISRIQKSGIAYVAKLLLDNDIPLEINNPIVDNSIFKRFNITEYNRKSRTLLEAKRNVEEVYGK